MSWRPSSSLLIVRTDRLRAFVVISLVTAVGGLLAGGGCRGSSQPTQSKATTSSTQRAASSTTSVTPPTTFPERPVAATDPIALAGQIEVAERAIRDPKISADQIARAAHSQQVAYRSLVVHPEWDAQVASALSVELRSVMEANVFAGRELRQLVSKPKDTLPAWRVIEPDPIDILRKAYEAGEAEFGVPWEYLAAVHLTETRMGRIRGVSTAGARGPMQFLPSTWESYGKGDIENTQDAIAASARYLAANGAPQRMADALYRYNPTPRYVNAVTSYAKQMEADENSFKAYYHWQVYYITTLGDAWLEVGYNQSEPRPVTPEDL